jgi:hypothetical protein
MAMVALVLAFVACGPPPKASAELIDKVRQEVATILKKDASQIEVRKALGVQGADELDVVEIGDRGSV